MGPISGREGMASFPMGKGCGNVVPQGLLNEVAFPPRSQADHGGSAGFFVLPRSLGYPPDRERPFHRTFASGMKIHTDLASFVGVNRPVLTTGTFDGVHRGHRTILHRLSEVARREHGESVLFTFHPHPRMVLFPGDDALRLLSTQEEKIALLAGIYPHKLACEAHSNAGGVTILSLRPFAEGVERQCLGGGILAMTTVDFGGRFVDLAGIHLRRPWPARI